LVPSTDRGIGVLERNKIVEGHFDKVIGEKAHLKYSFDSSSMSIKDRCIIRLLMQNGLEGKVCLDIGPGTGRWLGFMRQNGAHSLNAVDISSEVLKRCAELCDQVQKCDLEKDKLALDTDSVDVVIAIEVLEHLQDPAIFFSEIVRVVKPGGMVLMTLPNVTSFISRVRMVLGMLPVVMVSDPTHVGFYRQKDLISLMAPFGLVPEFHATSFSLIPTKPKSRIRLPSVGRLSNLDDSHVLTVRVTK